MEEFFSSRRELLLWLAVGIAVILIFATASVAPIWVDRVDESILAAVFILGLVLTLLAILSQGLRAHPSGGKLGLAFGFLAFSVLFFVRLSLTETSHLVEYGVIAMVIHEALIERREQGRKVPFPALFAVAAASTIGLVDEGVQFFLPSRVFDWRDVLFNFLAASGSTAAICFLRWATKSPSR